MRVTFNIRAEGIVTVDVPDDKLPKLETFIYDKQVSRETIDPADLPAYCGISLQELQSQVSWEVDDIWWKGQKS